MVQFTAFCPDKKTVDAAFAAMIAAMKEATKGLPTKPGLAPFENGFFVFESIEEFESTAEEREAALERQVMELTNQLSDLKRRWTEESTRADDR